MFGYKLKNSYTKKIFKYFKADVFNTFVKKRSSPNFKNKDCLPALSLTMVAYISSFCDVCEDAKIYLDLTYKTISSLSDSINVCYDKFGLEITRKTLASYLTLLYCNEQKGEIFIDDFTPGNFDSTKISGIKFSVAQNKKSLIHIDFLEKANKYLTVENDTLKINKEAISACYNAISNVDLISLGF